MEKIIKINVGCRTRNVGSTCNGTLEVYIDDEWTEEEIDKAKEDTAWEWMFEQIEWWWVDSKEA